MKKDINPRRMLKKLSFFRVMGNSKTVWHNLPCPFYSQKSLHPTINKFKIDLNHLKTKNKIKYFIFS